MNCERNNAENVVDAMQVKSSCEMSPKACAPSNVPAHLLPPTSPLTLQDLKSAIEEQLKAERLEEAVELFGIFMEKQ